MNRETKATNSPQGWWRTLLNRVARLDYSGYDYLADRMTALEQELAQLKRPQGSRLPPTVSERELR